MRNLIGGEHKWDGRYKEPVAKVYSQPIDEDGIWRIGKYKGKGISDAEPNYIKWILKNWTGLNARYERLLRSFL